jgi:small-conductance mechanosensitive channel
MNNDLSGPILDKLAQTGHEILGWLDQHTVNILMILIGAWLVRHFSSTVISRIVTHTVRRDLYPTKSDREKRIKTLKSLIKALVRTAVYIIAGILIIGEINPNYATALFASLGLFTVALGFSARDIVNDVLNGIFIVSESQYRVGDFVEIAGVSGTVEHITARSTILRDVNGNVHHVGNGDIVVATNQTFGYSNLNEDIVVATDTDLAKLAHIINHTGDEVAAIPELKNKVIKAPFYDGLDGYRQGGIVVKVGGITTAAEKYLVRSEFYRLLTKAILKYDIKLMNNPGPEPAGDKNKRK